MSYSNCGNRLRAVDLFCGAGGFSLAALRAGFDVVFAVENDPHAVRTYRSNFGERIGLVPKLYAESILDLDPAVLAENHFQGSQCDIVLGGPPCQGFSTHRIKDRGVGDPRNTLIHSYFSFVKALKPRTFLMENVPGILWPRHAEALADFYQAAEEAGYVILGPETLDARDFGVPQRRKRVFFLGVQDGMRIGGLQWPPARRYGEGEELPGWNTCREVFRAAPAGDPNDIHMNHSADIVAAFRSTPPNGGGRKDSGRVLPCHKNHDGHKDVYGRINQDQPGPTMTTACINPSKGRFVHPFDHHGITARQAARMQTFPDDFIFHGGLGAAGRQIGNAVPVQMGQILLETIADWLRRMDYEDAQKNSGVDGVGGRYAD